MNKMKAENKVYCFFCDGWVQPKDEKHICPCTGGVETTYESREKAWEGIRRYDEIRNCWNKFTSTDESVGNFSIRERGRETGQNTQ